MDAIVGAGEWNGMSSYEEAELMAELLGNCSLPNEAMSDSTHFMAGVVYSSDETSLSSGTLLFPFSTQETYYSTLSHHLSAANTHDLMTMDYCKNGFQDDSADMMGGGDFLNQDLSNDSTQSDNERGLAVARDEKASSSPSESRKRSSVPCDVPRSKKNMKCCNGNNAVVIQRNASCSEDESNETNNACLTSKGRRAPNPTRAGRGSATDPQSLYARKRRERINERLKLLQTLVPNGTKVDISTMLEEAVEYVKFLQLQIKLLSSDDLWMYSPIAYNGMDIGLDLRISTAAHHSS